MRLGEAVASSFKNKLFFFNWPVDLIGPGSCFTDAGCMTGQTGMRVSGQLAFTEAGDRATERLLIVTDSGNNAVHVIDVIARVHVGHVAAPRTIEAPKGVSARASVVAISTRASYTHSVCLFQGARTTWTLTRKLVVGGGGKGSPNPWL